MSCDNFYSRTELLLGSDSVNKLKKSRVLICGLGGVGGYVAEALVRIGIGSVVFIDSDKTEESNLNRQILATKETIGIPKVLTAVERGKSINPNGNFIPLETFLTPQNIPEILDLYNPDCVADAIDNITAKVSLAVECQNRDIPLISSMGTGNKTDPTCFKVTDIYKTSVCPLARTMRKLLKENGVKKLKVIYSDELPKKNNGKIGTVSFVPSVAGLLIANEVVKTLLDNI